MKSAPRPIPALWLALALLFAQGGGVWHRTAHALPAGTSQSQSVVHGPGVGHAHEDAHGPAAVFDDHEAGDVECRLFDQLLHADSLTSAEPALPAFGVAAAPAVEALRSARVAAAWRQRARGPPDTPRA